MLASKFRGLGAKERGRPLLCSHFRPLSAACGVQGTRRPEFQACGVTFLHDLIRLRKLSYLAHDVLTAIAAG